MLEANGTDDSSIIPLDVVNGNRDAAHKCLAPYTIFSYAISPSTTDL